MVFRVRSITHSCECRTAPRRQTTSRSSIESPAPRTTHRTIMLRPDITYPLRRWVRPWTRCLSTWLSTPTSTTPTESFVTGTTTGRFVQQATTSRCSLTYSRRRTNEPAKTTRRSGRSSRFAKSHHAERASHHRRGTDSAVQPRHPYCQGTLDTVGAIADDRNFAGPDWRRYRRQDERHRQTRALLGEEPAKRQNRLHRRRHRSQFLTDGYTRRRMAIWKQFRLYERPALSKSADRSVGQDSQLHLLDLARRKLSVGRRNAGRHHSPTRFELCRVPDRHQTAEQNRTVASLASCRQAVFIIRNS